jgi:hypothetical protein
MYKVPIKIRLHMLMLETQWKNTSYLTFFPYQSNSNKISNEWANACKSMNKDTENNTPPQKKKKKPIN